MPTFTEALSASDYDRDRLANELQIPPAEVGNWLRENRIPDQYRDDVQHKLSTEVTVPEPKVDARRTEKPPGPKKRTAKGDGPKKRTASRRRSTVGADVTQALTVCSSLAFASDEQQKAVVRLLKADGISDAESLADTAEGLISLNKSTDEAIGALKELVKLDSDIMVAVQIGGKDRRAVSELFRVASVVIDSLDDELPAENAELKTVERISTMKQRGMPIFEWLAELTG